MPTVSVIIPTYNRADLVLEAIASVQAQTGCDWELIVVDDGSTDNTAEVLRPLVESGLLRYVRQPNGGIAAGRNGGLPLASGRYLVFLDSDDLLTPTDRLARQSAFMDAHPEIGLSQGGFSKFTSAGEDLGYRDTSWFHGQLYPQILTHWSSLMAVPAVMIRRSLLEQVGPFNQSLSSGEDFDMWRRISRVSPFHAFPEEFARIRAHSASSSGDKKPASGLFNRVLQTAFNDDPALTPAFRRNALAVMYTFCGLNLLGDGGPLEIYQARRDLAAALKLRPLKVTTWAGWLATFLPAPVRSALARRWRARRHPHFQPGSKGQLL